MTTERTLLEEDARDDAMDALVAWFEEAVATAGRWARAMVLATGTAAPSARAVLVRHLDGNGPLFYSSSASRKAADLRAAPAAAGVFLWEPLGRQVRLEGTVERLGEEIARAGFDLRPHAGRLALWAGDQSSPVASREELEMAVRSASERFGEEVPMPPSWTAYRFVPSVVEFWQEREDGLHDRLHYSRTDAGGPWSRRRLAP